MGYHVTIVRTSNGQAVPITRDELARALPAMNGRLDLSPGRPPWSALCQPGKGDAGELLFFDDGELWAKTPGDEFVALMIELADLLGARVRGDELETYRTLEDVYQHPDDHALRRAAGPGRARPAAWREWKARLKVSGIAVVIGALYAAWTHFTGP